MSSGIPLPAEFHQNFSPKARRNLSRNSVPRNSVSGQFRDTEFRGSRNSAEFYSVRKNPLNSVPMEFRSAEFRSAEFCDTEFCFCGTQNSAEFFTEFRGILFRRKNSAEFHRIFQAEFLRNSGIPYKKFDRNIIPPEFFLTE